MGWRFYNTGNKNAVSEESNAFGLPPSLPNGSMGWRPLSLQTEELDQRFFTGRQVQE